MSHQGQNSSLYINKGNRDIVTISISITIYFMEFKNQTVAKNKEFVTLKNVKVHNTQYTEVFSQLVRINGKIYVCLQGKSYYEENELAPSSKQSSRTSKATFRPKNTKSPQRCCA